MPEQLIESSPVLRFPVIFLCDTSGSMYGAPIQIVNRSLNRFVEEASRCPKDRARYDVAVISFNDIPRIVQSFCPLNELQHVSFIAGGGSNISEAVLFADQLIRERRRYFLENGVHMGKTNIFLIADGYGEIVPEALTLIREQTSAGRINLWVISTEDHDVDTINGLADGLHQLVLSEDIVDDISFLLSTAFPCTCCREAPSLRITPPSDRTLIPDLDEWLRVD